MSRCENSIVVPSASPTASPMNAPSARSRCGSDAAAFFTPGARRAFARALAPRAIGLSTRFVAHEAAPFRTHFSCSDVSIAPGRASRTWAKAASGSTPSSTSRRAAIMPARPNPPRQWIKTFSPALSLFRSALLWSGHPASNAASGMLTSRIGRCSHSMLRRRTSSSSDRMPSNSNSCASIKVTTTLAFQVETASRSIARSLAHAPDKE